MGKIKIHEIAKKLGLTSKEVLDVAKGLNIEAKSHLSGVSDEEAEKIESACSKNNRKNKEEQSKETNKKEKVEKNEKTESKREEKAPVIIRREVIINQEENEKKKTEKTKKEEKRNNVGFVERKQNKDYNIVYRNKPNKPMTVSELFGLKKEETKKEEVEEVKEVVDPKAEKNAVIKEEKLNIEENRDKKIKEENAMQAQINRNDKKIFNNQERTQSRENVNRNRNNENRNNNNNYNNYNNRDNQNRNRNNNYNKQIPRMA